MALHNNIVFSRTWQITTPFALTVGTAVQYSTEHTKNKRDQQSIYILTRKNSEASLSFDF